MTSEFLIGFVIGWIIMQVFVWKWINRKKKDSTFCGIKEGRYQKGGINTCPSTPPPTSPPKPLKGKSEAQQIRKIIIEIGEKHGRNQ